MECVARLFDLFRYPAPLRTLEQVFTTPLGYWTW